MFLFPSRGISERLHSPLEDRDSINFVFECLGILSQNVWALILISRLCACTVFTILSNHVDNYHPFMKLSFWASWSRCRCLSRVCHLSFYEHCTFNSQTGSRGLYGPVTCTRESQTACFLRGGMQGRYEVLWFLCALTAALPRFVPGDTPWTVHASLSSCLV